MKPWRDAMQLALYGKTGFFTAGAGPAAHFRTSVHVGAVFADAVVRLIEAIDFELGQPESFDVVDVGAGNGELLAAVRRLLADSLDHDLSDRVRLIGVELAARPVHLDPSIAWSSVTPQGVVGLVVANEWLDNVALDVVEVAGNGVCLVEVDPATGEEQLGPVVSTAITGWLEQWWPLDPAAVGDRAECGDTRDEAWASVVTSMKRGVAIAIDYAHTRAERAAGAFSSGTLTAYRDGRLVAVVPDGSCDLTAHVALDACAAAGIRAGATNTRLMTQGQALQSLGVNPRRPPLALAHDAPSDYLKALSSAGASAELMDPAGLGGFTWLVQGKGASWPGEV